MGRLSDPVFAERLIRLRARWNLSQQQVAGFLRVDRATVSRWEAGLVVPTGKNLERALQWMKTRWPGGSRGRFAG